MRLSTIIVAAGALALQPALSGEAVAACKRFAFLVNDYGKDVPTRDSQALLDKHIAKSMAELGVKQYKTGPKSVHCELFLNFIVFDEHTCQAEATVCWGGEEPSAAASAAGPDATSKAAGKTEAIKTGSVKAAPTPKAATPKAAPADGASTKK